MTHVDMQTREELDRSVRSIFTKEAGGASRSVLMFSGGRDSTLSAARMYEQGLAPILVTISSSHLVGMEKVRERVRELSRHLSVRMPWLVVRQPEELKADTSFYDRTCLPCHHAYVVAGAAVAAKAGAKTLAFGYASYQNAWPEQTPLAIEHLTAVLCRHGIRLVLPVYDLLTRDQAVAELRARQLSTEALEQKCVQQINNLALTSDRLEQQIELWEHAIEASLVGLQAIEIEVIEASGRD
jgi:predicted subunit of tRNA(5-methylaminomethyl-2-thiouridylate) methyltransferase